MAKLPTIVSSIPRDLRMFLDRVREALNANGDDALVTLRSLETYGLVKRQGTTVFPVAQNGAYVSPPAPLNLTADGALASIILSWDTPTYLGHAYTEVWAAAEPEGGGNPDLGEASLVGMAPGTVFSHNLGADTSRWYWVRFVNIADEAGPYNAVEGLEAATGQDPTYLLDLLAGQLTESQLYQTLGERIALIDSDATVAGSVAARIAAEATLRASEISAEAQARADALAAEALARGTAITGEQTARQSADDALAQSITTLTSSVGANTSAIQVEQTARSTADAGLAASITSLDSRLTTAEGDVTGNSSAITSLDTRVTTAEGGITANASDITSLQASVASNLAAVQSEATARANGDSALANDITTLTAAVGSNLAAVQTEAIARANADGDLQAQYTVKVEANGYVAGFGLANTANDATPTSEFIVRADKFAVASPSGPGVAPAEPFFVRTTAATVNGVDVPVGVYMRDVFVQNGSIGNAKIGNAAIDAAKIANAAIVTAAIGDAQITAAKIEDLAVTTAKIAEAAITTAKIANAQITNALIADATIDLAKIDRATITDLSAITANMGLITAGKMQSADQKFVIDLDNKTISIET